MAVGAIPLPATVNGLPLHPLVVHAVVVILPLTVLGAIGISIWPAMRRHFGMAVLLASIVSGILVPIGTSSGEQFRARLGSFIAQRVTQHANYAHKLLPLAAGLFVLVLLTMVVDLSRRLGPAIATASDPAIPAGPAGPAGLPEGGAGGVAVAARPQAPAASVPTTRLERGLGRLLPAALRAQTAFLRAVQPVLGILTVAMALVLLWYVYKTGDSGAKVVWGGVK